MTKLRFVLLVNRNTGLAVIAGTPVDIQSAVTKVSLTTTVVSASTPPKLATATKLGSENPKPVKLIPVASAERLTAEMRMPAT